MISRKHRFRGQNDIRTVYRRGQSVKGQSVSLKYLADNRAGGYRCSVVVSKKVHKSAVVRNRIRRRIYETIRGFESKFNGSPDLVITVFQPDFATSPYPQIVLAISRLLEKANLLKN